MKFVISSVLLSLQAVGTLAAPLTENPSTTSSPALIPREAKVLYQNPNNNGDVVIDYGDGKLVYGDRLPSSILDIIRDNCPETACKPGYGGYTFTSSVVEGGRRNDKTFRITVEGEFAVEGKDGSKSQLLEVAKLAFQQVFNAGVAKYNPEAWYVTNECPPSRTHGCLTQSGATIVQWESVDHIHVSIGEKNLNIGVEMIDEKSGTGVCEAMAAASAGIGLANAVAGFASGLLASGCTLAKDAMNPSR